MTHGERRSAILRAAAKLFEHYGHGKTTIADVAREAGVGVGTVYLEFDSKEAIVQELSLETHAGVLDAMRAAMLKETDDVTRFTAILVARTRCFVELRTKGQHACELVHCKTEGVKAAHQRFRDEERALLCDLLERGRRSGAFGGIRDPNRTAALIVRAFASLSPPWVFGGEEDPIETAEALASILLDGICTRPATTRKRNGR